MSSPRLVAQPVDRFGRTAAGLTVAGGLLIAALAVEVAVGPDLGAVWFAVAAVGLAAWPLGLSVLYRDGAAGGRAGQVTLVVAIVAFVVFALAHVIEALSPDSAVSLFFLGQTIGAVALTVAGVAIVRTGRLDGWRRSMPLLCGLYPLVVLTPVFLLAGHDSAASFVAIAGWGLCWAALGVALRPRVTA
jgi:hypothetical protein